MAMDSVDVDSLEELLPGIPNDITLDEICTKLNAMDAIRLSSVSETWRQALVARAIFDARARARSTETLLVLAISDYHSGRACCAFLYSLRTKEFSILPSIPDHGSLSQYIGMDGRLYAAGGVNKGKSNWQSLYMLDLAGQIPWVWKECASMLEPRVCFRCAALNGKIYAFGGISLSNRGYKIESEVYDPQVDAWSQITPMRPGLIIVGATPVGDEIFVLSHCTVSLWWQIYHPVREDWRLVQIPITPLLAAAHLFTRPLSDRLFRAKGKLYAINTTSNHIDVYDEEGKTWVRWCSLAFPGLEEYDIDVLVHSTSLGNELVVIGSWMTGNNPTNRTREWCLLHSSGFSNNTGHVVMTPLTCSSAGHIMKSPTRCELHHIFSGLVSPVFATSSIDL